MQHSQKTGGHPSTFRRLGVPTREPLSFQTFKDSLTGQAKRISFFSITCALFSLRRRRMSRGVPATFQRVDVPTSDLSSVLITSSISPSVPLQPNALGATLGKVER